MTEPASCSSGAAAWSARACCRRLLLQTVLGGFSPTGASTNTGWFALIVALMCIPFGGLLLALGHRQVAAQPVAGAPRLGRLLRGSTWYSRFSR